MWRETSKYQAVLKKGSAPDCRVLWRICIPSITFSTYTSIFVNVKASSGLVYAAKFKAVRSICYHSIISVVDSEFSFLAGKEMYNLRVVKWVIGPGRLVEGGIVVVRVHQFKISRQDNQLIIPFLQMFLFYVKVVFLMSTSGLAVWWRVAWWLQVGTLEGHQNKIS